MHATLGIGPEREMGQSQTGPGPNGPRAKVGSGPNMPRPNRVWPKWAQVQTDSGHMGPDPSGLEPSNKAITSVFCFRSVDA